jgi:ATP-binding cassette subfamily C protein
MDLIRYFVAAYPRQSAVTLACLVVASLAEGLGLATAVPLLGILLGRGTDAASPQAQSLAASVEGALAGIGLPFTLLTVGSVVALLLWLKAGLVLFAMRQVGNTVAFISTDLRLEVLSHLFEARWGYFTRHPLGRLTNSIATEATRAADAYRQLTLAAKYTTLTAVGLAVAFWLSWELAVITICGYTVIGLALARLVRLARRAGQKQTTVINSLLARLTDALLNLKLLKATRREHLLVPLVTRDTNKLQKALRKQVLAQETLNALQEPLMFLILLATAIFSQVAGLLAPEELLVMLAALMRSLSSAAKIQRRYQLASIHAPALDSLRELVASAAADAEQLPSGPAPTLERAIELCDVRYSYDDQYVLDGVGLEIPAGEITALVGGSGGGKTTVTDLVTGLIQPDSGAVTIDGARLDELDVAAWRARIGYVPQELVLLGDSVRTNVGFGDPTISDADIEDALRDAGVWDVVSALPGGLDAPVGERGSLLSGGQRARIAIARALACRPSLLVLDEATAALDPETEAVVLETIAQLRGRVTVLAISHQPAISELADRVYRLEAGQAERVERSELIAS